MAWLVGYGDDGAFDAGALNRHRPRPQVRLRPRAPPPAWPGRRRRFDGLIVASRADVSTVAIDVAMAAFVCACSHSRLE